MRARSASVPVRALQALRVLALPVPALRELALQALQLVAAAREPAHPLAVVQLMAAEAPAAQVAFAQSSRA
jgi:hypothetical protein